MSSSPVQAINPSTVTVTATPEPVSYAVDNSNANDVNDLSDICISRPSNSPVQPILLPIRGEKRFIPEDPLALLGQSAQTSSAFGPYAQNGAANASFFTTAATEPFTDWVTVRVPHRGVSSSYSTSSPAYDPHLTATYRFLINPNTAQISRNTEDSQAFARGGWQFGVWGEGLIHVAMAGHTPGYYWAKGLTDEYAYFTESWRNLQQLVIVFENNGYWFEGEEANEGPLAPGFTRRRIKKHQDIQLVAANYIWYGMFDNLTVTLDAEHPYRAEFSLSFLAWKERTRQGSPYSQWGIQNSTERGHSYSAVSSPGAVLVPPSNAGQLTALPLSLSPSGLSSLSSTTPSVIMDSGPQIPPASGRPASSPLSGLSSLLSTVSSVVKGSRSLALPSALSLSPAVASEGASQYLVSGGSGSATPNLGLFSPSEVFA